MILTVFCKGIFESGFVQWAKNMGEEDPDWDDDDDEDEDEDGDEEEGGEIAGDAPMLSGGASGTTYQGSMNEEDNGDDEETMDLSGRGSLVDASTKEITLRKMIFDILDGRGTIGLYVEAFIFFLIFLTVTTAILGTVESLKTGLPDEIMSTIEAVATYVYFSTGYMTEYFTNLNDYNSITHNSYPHYALIPQVYLHC
jgi:hypothetical protein